MSAKTIFFLQIKIKRKKKHNPDETGQYLYCRCCLKNIRHRYSTQMKTITHQRSERNKNVLTLSQCTSNQTQTSPSAWIISHQHFIMIIDARCETLVQFNIFGVMYVRYSVYIFCLCSLVQMFTLMSFVLPLCIHILLKMHVFQIAMMQKECNK